MERPVHSQHHLREVHDSLTEVIKQIANEPSLGLYFVQQHVHKVVPVVVSLKVQLVEETQEVVLSTEDAKDALTAVSTMKELGPSVIGKMRTILNSTISSLQDEQNVKRVQLGSPFSEGIGQTSNVEGGMASTDASGVETTTSANYKAPTILEWHSETSSSGYICSAFESALQKAGNLGWKTSVLQVSHNMPIDATEAAEVGSFLNTTAEALKQFAVIKPARYVRAVFDSKPQRSDYEAKDDQKILYAEDLERKNDMEEVESRLCIKDLVLEDTYEQLHEEQTAKLEAWLGNS
ncbi:hypothetical protein O6H91_Y190000 [Diphasiastrum complanatum]|nr:hypothetical protein O6H91_Y190000 [Diphasiastrum complanatum]